MKSFGQMEKMIIGWWFWRCRGNRLFQRFDMPWTNDSSTKCLRTSRVCRSRYHVRGGPRR